LITDKKTAAKVEESFEDYYDEGTLKSETHFKEGQKDGLNKEYFVSGF